MMQMRQVQEEEKETNIPHNPGFSIKIKWKLSIDIMCDYEILIGVKLIYFLQQILSIRTYSHQ